MTIHLQKWMTAVVLVAVHATGFAPAAWAQCDSTTVSNRAELNAAIGDYNANCGIGDSLVVTVNGTVLLTSGTTKVDNATSAELLITGGTIDGADSNQVLRVGAGTVTLDAMLIANGNNPNGGCLRVDGDGELRLVNTTVTGCTASTAGAILNFGGALYLSNSTITDNVRSSNGASVWIYPPGTMHMENSIIANTLDDSDNPIADCVRSTGATVTFSPGTSNLIEDPGSCDSTGTNTLSGDPLLEPLADNGGNVQTLAMSIWSPVINAGDDSAASGLSFDARGVGFPRIIGTAVDLGAYESSLLTAPVEMGSREYVLLEEVSSLTEARDACTALGDFELAGWKSIADLEAMIDLCSDELEARVCYTRYLVDSGAHVSLLDGSPIPEVPPEYWESPPEYLPGDNVLIRGTSDLLFEGDESAMPLCKGPLVFIDGFESGDLSRWQ